MKKIVRVGSVSDQDRWRREDCRRMTPNERVQALLDYRCSYFPEGMKHVCRKAVVRQMRGHSHG